MTENRPPDLLDLIHRYTHEVHRVSDARVLTVQNPESVRADIRYMEAAEAATAALDALLAAARDALAPS